MNKYQCFLSCTRANTTIMFALSIVPLVGVAGVAVDMVSLSDVKSDISEALDAAVLAGSAAEKNHLAEARLYYDNNFNSDRASEIDVKFSLESSNRVIGTVNGKLKTGLSSVLGISDLKISVTATADRNSGGNVCILALAPNAAQAMLINSGADIKAPDCEIHVKSTANPAAILNSGIDVEADKICIEGSTIIDNGSNVENVKRSCTTLDNPYLGKFPVPSNLSCDFSNLNYSGKVELNPGVYCGWHNFNAAVDVDFEPGVYIIKNGGWNVNGGKWKGDDITFYYADTSKIQFNSAVKASLKAPTTGDYAGALFVETEGLADSQFVLDDNLGFDMEGIIYLPSREVVVNSGASFHSQRITAVMRTIIFNSSKWHLKNYDDNGESKQVRLIK